MRSIAQRFEKGLFAAAVAGAVLPLLAVALSVVPHRPIQKIAMSRMTGVTVPAPPPTFSLSAYLDRSLQAKAESWFVDRMGRAREVYLRVHNGIEYLFQRSPVPSIVFGRERTLFERPYVDDWCGGPPKVDTDSIVQSLAEVQARIKARGRAFVMVISPSKAAVYPELLPVECAHGAQRPYDRFVQAAAAAGVEVVDGSSLLKAARRTQPWPVFGRNGTHWNELGATYATDAVLASVDRQLSLGIRRIKVESVRVDGRPFDEEKDLADLMNLPVSLRVYPSPHPVIAKDEGGRAVRMILCGSSFGWQMLRLLATTDTLAEDSRSYFYFSRVTAIQNGRLQLTGASGLAAADLKQFIGQTEAIVLEANEANLGSGHVLAFAEAVLADLP